MVTDAQVRKLMEEMAKHGRIGDAALKSGMDRKTARRYVKTETLPSVMAKERTYRTRKNPFEQDWREIEGMLDESPTLEAKTSDRAILHCQYTDVDWRIESDRDAAHLARLPTRTTVAPIISTLRHLPFSIFGSYQHLRPTPSRTPLTLHQHK